MAILSSYFNTLHHFNKFASELKKSSKGKLTLSESHETLAKMAGFSDYHHAVTELSKEKNEKKSSMIMDLEKNNAWSWEKLCSLSKGVILNFGSDYPPRINIFELNNETALPNKPKMKKLFKVFGLNEKSDKDREKIYALFTWFRTEKKQKIFTKDQLITKFDFLDDLGTNLSHDYLANLFDLKFWELSPCQKDVDYILTFISLILSHQVNDDSSFVDQWQYYNKKFITTAILNMYDSWTEEKSYGYDDTILSPSLSNLPASLKELYRYVNDSPELYNNELKNNLYFNMMMDKIYHYIFHESGSNPEQTNIYFPSDAAEYYQGKKVVVFEVSLEGVNDARKKAIYQLLIEKYFLEGYYNKELKKALLILKD